jgi:hypothetical protein
MFSFCSLEVKPLPTTGNLFFRSGRPARFFAGAGRVDVGEKDLPEGGRFLPKPYHGRQLAAVLRELTGH